MAATVQHGLAPLSDLAKRRLKVDFLERTRAKHLRVDLACQCERGRPVYVGVPKPREHVGGAGPGDRKTRRGSSRQLAVGRGGERRGAFVAHAEIAKPSGFFLAPNGFGEPEVRMADDTEHCAHAPARHRFRHQVRHSARYGDWLFESDIDAVFAIFYGINGDAVVIGSGRLAGKGMKVPAVPRTAEKTLLDRAFSERSFLVGTLVVERRVFALVMRHANGGQPAGHGLHASFGKLVRLERFVPNSFGLGHRLSFMRGHGASTPA